MILERIAEKTKQRVEEQKQRLPLSDLRLQALEGAALRQEKNPFVQALEKQGISFICEVKKASPSRGVIAEHFPFVDIAREYEEAGADAVSVLTEPYFFQGSNKYLEEIRREISLPILRKDFTVDEYMIYEAETLGADAVLLICSILSGEQLKEYVQLTRELRLAALVEAHDENEVRMALEAGAEMIGVNNRNLKDFTVDIDNSLRLRRLVPDNILFVSESGMKTAADIQRLRDNGTNAVLIGETFMRSRDKKAMLKELAGR